MTSPMALRAEKFSSGGLSLAMVGSRLNEQGHTTRTGSAWSAMQVKGILDHVKASD
jgi:hypothetical protein